MEQAKAVLLEPIMKVEVIAPVEFAGDLMSDMNGRRGRITGMDTRAGRRSSARWCDVGDAHLRNDLTSMTQGVARSPWKRVTTITCRRCRPIRSSPRTRPRWPESRKKGVDPASMSDLPSGAAFADRARGALMGLAVGDAVGTTVEFSSRGSFTPVTDMVGGGPFGLKAGQWTDDIRWRCAWPPAWSKPASSTPKTRWGVTAAGGAKGT